MPAAKTAPTMPKRRPWTEADVAYAAWLAGNGRTADEIAFLIGGTSAAVVAQVLRSRGLKSLRKRGEHIDVITVRWKNADRQRLNEIADRLDREPEELLALITRRVLDGGIDAVNALVDRYDVIG
ncbi:MULTISPECIES: hypothetical protein [unclassified Chelatococcus]|uniref:hypothetical protein n=1 Tax=unclassified Chelatococcus TaxID=2638111 RepID=UPI0002D27A72|nr:MULTISPECIES: hypothetical protein [unclassified Chelatococcus]ALA17187.1 hypothetical protein AL346_06925 [Chelatococcus sp. CO-6]